MQKKVVVRDKKLTGFLCAAFWVPLCNSYCSIWNEVTPSHNHLLGDRDRFPSLFCILCLTVWFFVPASVTCVFLIHSAGVRSRQAGKRKVPHSLASSFLRIPSISPRPLRKLLSPITRVWRNSLNLLWAWCASWGKHGVWRGSQSDQHAFLSSTTPLSTFQTPAPSHTNISQMESRSSEQWVVFTFHS